MVDDKKRLESLFYFKNKLMLNHGITASGFLSYLATLFTNLLLVIMEWLLVYKSLNILELNGEVV